MKIYPPSKEISELVSCFWSISGLSEPLTELVYPTGKMQLIFHYGKPFIEMAKSGANNVQPQFSLCGQLISYCHVKALQDCGMIGVVLHAHAAGRFFKIPLSEITGQTIDLAYASHDWTNYKDKFQSCKDTISRKAVIENFLLANYRFTPDFSDHFIKSCVNEIMINNGLLLPVESLKNYRLSDRSMQRMFKEKIGLSPKKFTDIVRFGHVADIIEKTDDLTSVAYDAGFYDQSHCIKEFKKFSGLTPTEFKSKL